MSTNIPEDLRYTKEHEWAKEDGDVLIIGITDHAQDQLGDVVFLELPDVGTELSTGAAFGVVESVKAVSDLYAPLDGAVTEINSDLIDAPERVNTEPYGVGWMLKVKPASADAYSGLLDAAAYKAFVESEG